ncbi:MAG: hypothetical protein ACI8XD_000473 [Thermoproteota archaeon]|jgi:hypothetical protein
MVLIDADWYVDPLGRFEGRFFDGERWTERVSDGGAIAIDPDFIEHGTETPVLSGPSEPAAEEPNDLSLVAIAAPLDDLVSVEPAGVRVRPDRGSKASSMQESPARVVAVLGSSLVRAPGTLVRPASVGGGPGRGPIVLGLLSLIVALAVAGLLLLSDDDPGGDVVAKQVELDSEQEARVEDLEAGGSVGDLGAEAIEELEVDASIGAVGPGTPFALSEAIEVGSLRIINGESVLVALADWHQGFAAQRGVELGPLASCWFGQLGGAAVQVAHCGPVGGSADSEFFFDSVPLLFEDTMAGLVAQPVVNAAMTDAVLANALTLVGRKSTPPPLSLEGASQGDRDNEGGG